VIEATDILGAAEPPPKPRRPLTEIEVFVIKVAIVFVAIFAFWIAVAAYVQRSLEHSALLKGGHAFWDQVEKRLYSLADEPDLSPAKKAQVIAALEKLSIKYRPFIEAMSPPARK
jgi:hypothetical protein